MKWICLILLLFIANVRGYGQPKIEPDCKTFVLNIRFTNLDTGRVLLFYPSCDSNNYNHVGHLQNGQVQFKGKINNAGEALLYVNPSNRLLDDPSVIRLILESKHMNLTANVHNLLASNIKIKGSVSQAEKERWEAKNKATLNYIDSIGNSFGRIKKRINGKDSTAYKKQKKILIRELDSSYNKLLQSCFRYIKSHPKAYFSSYLLYRYHNRMPLDSLQKYFLLLDSSTVNCVMGKSVLNELYTLSSQKFRETQNFNNYNKELNGKRNLYDFTLMDSSGQSVKLSKYKGRPTLLFFWASWCGICHKQIPYLNKIIDTVGSSKINFLSISIDKIVSNWKTATNKYNTPGINLVDKKGVLPAFYRFMYVPRLIILDANGSIINADAPLPSTKELKKILGNLIENGN